MRTSSRRFEPPHCPWKECSDHVEREGWRWQPLGHFERQAEPRRIRRFRCLTCWRTFSTQSFDTTYYLKRPDLQPQIARAIVACSGVRQAARTLGVAPSTVQRQASRLARHALLYEARAGVPTVREDLVLDGLRTFEFSQYWPCDVNLLVGADSYFVYGFSLAPLRRSGTMRPDQRAKRARLEKRWGKPDPRATEKSVTALLSGAFPPGTQLCIRSDEHPSYPRAFRRTQLDVRHVTVSSKQRRDPSNPLFAINLADSLVRHSAADQKRETIAFAKRAQGLMERAAVFILWRNRIKLRSERRKDSLTPAQFVAQEPERLDWETVLLRRIFPSKVQLPGHVEEIYWRRVKTAQLPNGTKHELKNAA